ncbi:hypothetical protein BSU04_34315 [Caballeronia sordidicola]|jgi:hypothetical protein|uniref:Uncharacterized protein n=1 Tax=Caballeronia sordidicola TaxID=196367 RepID=A0A226WTN0_CABSO|nr:hypothetical protein BSU04_34315 [Caballeronia sordidicola]
MRALSLTSTLKQVGEVVHDAGLTTSSALLFYRFDRALD